MLFIISYSLRNVFIHFYYIFISKSKRSIESITRHILKKLIYLQSFSMPRTIFTIFGMVWERVIEKPFFIRPPRSPLSNISFSKGYIRNIKHLDDFSKFKINKIDSFFQLFFSRYGIGYFLSKLLCKYLGLHFFLKYSKASIYKNYSSVKVFLLKYASKFDFFLKLYVGLRQKRLMLLRTYKGLRLWSGYPSNGQRTRSNAKTASKLPYSIRVRSYYF